MLWILGLVLCGCRHCRVVPSGPLAGTDPVLDSLVKCKIVFAVEVGAGTVVEWGVWRDPANAGFPGTFSNWVLGFSFYQPDDSP